MKNIISIFLLALCTACSNKEVSMKQTDTAPTIGLAGDTLFVREKDPFNLNGNGVFTVQALPANHQLHLRLNDTSGLVHFSYRGQAIPNNQPVIVAGEWNSLFCKADASGVFGIELTLRDELGRISSKTLVIKAAAAQRPKAALMWKADERDSESRRYYFDAGGCTQPYGKIMSYHYFINGQSVVTTAEQFQYIFHSKGSYPLSFHVTDDLGQHSDTLHQTIVVL